MVRQGSDRPVGVAFLIMVITANNTTMPMSTSLKATPDRLARGAVRPGPQIDSSRQRGRHSGGHVPVRDGAHDGRRAEHAQGVEDHRDHEVPQREHHQYRMNSPDRDAKSALYVDQASAYAPSRSVIGTLGSLGTFRRKTSFRARYSQ